MNQNLKKTLVKIKEVLFRFPSAILAATGMAFIYIYLILNNLDFESEAVVPFIKLIHAFTILALAEVLFIASTFFGESKSWPNKYKRGLDLLVAIFIFIVFSRLNFLIDNPGHSIEKEDLRLVLWSLSATLSLTFVGLLFWRKNIINVFWQHVKKMVVSALLTALYCAVINIGLVIIWASINYLFDTDIDKIILVAGVLVSTLFSSIFFLSRLPKDPIEAAENKGYPKQIKIFTQYVLLPLLTIYFLILYSYTVKVLIVGEWPKGTLVYMISGFSLFGIVIYMVLYAWQEQFRWIRIFRKIFFAALIPQVIMFFVALWLRISDYSLTENRYLLILLGLWLLVAGIYFLISRRQDIRLVPITLCLVMILFSFGPWSIFNVARQCQSNRLISILDKYQAVSEGKIVKIPAPDSVSVEDKDNINDLVVYLYNAHGPANLQKLFSQEIKSNDGSKSYLLPSEIVKDLIGLENKEEEELINQAIPELSSEGNFSISALSPEEPISEESDMPLSQKYKYVMKVGGTETNASFPDGNWYGLRIPSDQHYFTVQKNREDVIGYDFADFISQTLEKYKYRPEDIKHIIIEAKNEDMAFGLSIEKISGERIVSGDIIEYRNVSIMGSLFFSPK